MRIHYFDELRTSLAAARVLDNPQLAIRLLEMHNDRRFESEVESLSGIISTNHDGLLQIACQIVFWRSEFGAIVCFRRLCTSNFSVNAPAVAASRLVYLAIWSPVQVAMLHEGSRYSSHTVGSHLRHKKNRSTTL